MLQVVRSLPWKLQFNELLNEACHDLLTMIQFGDCYVEMGVDNSKG